MFQLLKKFLNAINTESKVIYSRMMAGKYVRNIIIFFCEDILELFIEDLSYIFRCYHYTTFSS